MAGGRTNVGVNLYTPQTSSTSFSFPTGSITVKKGCYYTLLYSDGYMNTGYPSLSFNGPLQTLVSFSTYVPNSTNYWWARFKATADGTATFTITKSNPNLIFYGVI